MDDRIDFFDFCLLLETQPSSISSEKLDITSIYNAFVNPDTNKFDPRLLNAAIDYTYGQELPKSVLEDLKSFAVFKDEVDPLKNKGLEIFYRI